MADSTVRNIIFAVCVDTLYTPKRYDEILRPF